VTHTPDRAFVESSAIARSQLATASSRWWMVAYATAKLRYAFAD